MNRLNQFVWLISGWLTNDYESMSDCNQRKAIDGDANSFFFSYLIHFVIF